SASRATSPPEASGAPMLPALVTDTVAPDLRSGLDAALLWGHEAVVLRTVGRGRVPDVNEAQVRRMLLEAEMPVAAVDPGLFEGAASARAAAYDDIEALATLAPFCRRLTCETVLVGPLAAEPRPVEDAATLLRRAGDRADALGLRLAVRNDGETAESLAALVRAVDHPAVAAAWSPADSRAAGETPEAAMGALVNVPLEAIVADEAFAHEAADGPAADALAALVRAGFDGTVSLAFSGVPDDGLGTSTALIRALRLARRAAR
ncbi:MAG: TIM barrel protein, partial [Bacteroidota bacterium]